MELKLRDYSRTKAAPVQDYSRTSDLRSSSLPHSKERVWSQEQPTPYLPENKITLYDRFLCYLSEAGWPEEYAPGSLQEKYCLLRWFASNLVPDRPIKTKQLLLYGEPGTQKTLILKLLSSVLRTYNASNDFPDAPDNYDLWVFDEFPIVEDVNMRSGFGQGMTSSANNTLLRILDGQECRLDTKYGHVFTKRKNVPIV